MKVAVALLTCDRYDYTVRTVESLLEHNDPNDMVLFHADDASTDERLVPYVQSRGFETVVQNKERAGCSPTTERLLKEVASRVDPDVPFLYLQNDFESTRPVPMDLVTELLQRDDCGLVQLAYRRPRSRYNKRLKWTVPSGKPWVFGDTSNGDYVVAQVGKGCGYHPTIGSLDYWLASIPGIRRERDFVRANGMLGKRMYRLTLPPMRHIGKATTPDGLYGIKRKNRRARRNVAAGARNNRQLGVSACEFLASELRPGMRTLECGSGATTWLFYLLGCNHTALEHDKRYAPQLPVVQVCPLVGDPLWYNWQPEHPCDLILIDGPPGCRSGRRASRRRPGRRGIMRVIDQLVGPETVVVLDDTNRGPDSQLAQDIAERFDMSRTDYPASRRLDFRKQFTVLR